MMSKIKALTQYISNLFHHKVEYLPKFKKDFGSFGENSVIHFPSNINDKQHIFIGENTTILSNSRLNIYNYLTNLESKIMIGKNCYFGYNLSILAGGNINIGNDVLIASNVLISSENHGIDPESEVPYMNQNLICKEVVIGSGSWIGEKVCILPGVTIGTKCVIGAGSVVTKSIPDYCVAAGNPAKIIKKYNFLSHQWEKI